MRLSIRPSSLRGATELREGKAAPTILPLQTTVENVRRVLPSLPESVNPRPERVGVDLSEATS